MDNSNLAVFSGFTNDIPILERLSLIKEVGFGATMLNYNDDNSAVKVDEQCAHCNSIGLKICCAHLRFNDGNAIWTKDSWADQLIHDIASCSRNGINIVVMHPTQGDVHPPVNAEGIARVRRIAEFCQQHNVTLAIENKRNTIHIDKIFEAIDNPALAYCYDIGHEAIYHGQGKVIQRYNHLYPLAILHLHDNHLTADEHMLPMDGDIDYEAVTSQLHSIGYKGYILLEPQKFISPIYKDMTNKEFLQRALAKAQYIQGKVMGN